MFSLAVKSGVPLISVHTTDTVNVQMVIEALVGEAVLPAPEKTAMLVQHSSCRVFWTLKHVQCDEATYTNLITHEKCLIVINHPDPGQLAFSVGSLPTPKSLIRHFLEAVLPEDEVDPMLSCFSGLTLKDLGEVARLTMVRDGSLTAKGVLHTRAMLASKTQGIQQVDTTLDVYMPYVPLEDWVELNGPFFMNPPDSRLTPRGVLLNGPPGCISGDMKLNIKRHDRKRHGTNSFSISLQDLYYKYNSAAWAGRVFRKDTPTYTQSMAEDGTVYYNKIVAVVLAGFKECWKVTTESGRQLTCTPDHPLCTESGNYTPLEALQVGDKIRVKGSGKPTKSSQPKAAQVTRREVHVKHHPFASVKVVKGYTYKRLRLSRIIVEADMNNLTVKQYIGRLNNGELEGLKFLDPNLEVHHRDENPRHDSLENLEVLTKEEHARLHGKVENFKTEHYVCDSIVKIEPVGKSMTYDIQMEAPDHNFVANGLIVHNTGKSQAAKYIANQWNVPAYRLDLTSALGKYVGESEGNFSRILSILDQEQPALVLLDEVEKLFTQATDQGVTFRLLSQLLWWLQEHTSRVFVVMTTNDMDAIPQELYRGRRIDRVFNIEKLSFGSGVTLGLKILQSFKPVITHTENKLLSAAISQYVSTQEDNAISHAHVTQIVYDLIKQHKWLN